MKKLWNKESNQVVYLQALTLHLTLPDIQGSYGNLKEKNPNIFWLNELYLEISGFNKSNLEKIKD